MVGGVFSYRDKFKHRSMRVPIEQWSKSITLEFSPRLPKTCPSNPEEVGKDCGKSSSSSSSTVVESPLQPLTVAAGGGPVVADPRGNLSSSSAASRSSGLAVAEGGSPSEFASGATAAAEDAADGGVSKDVDKEKRGVAKRVSTSSKGRDAGGESCGGVGGGSSSGNERLHGKKKGPGGSSGGGGSSTGDFHGGVEEASEEGMDGEMEMFELPPVLMLGATPLDARLASVRALLEGEGVGVGFRFGEHMCLLAALQAFCEEWGPLRKR